MEESREDCVGCVDLMPSITGSVPNLPPSNTAPVAYSNYDAMIAGTAFSPCDEVWSFNGSTYGDQPGSEKGL
jgi:hypothetical protein